jgi:putative ABC transport system permease protein
LLAVSAMVVLVGLSGMLTALLAGLNERRREMAILRSLGARPLHILSLIVGEALFLTLLGLALGLAMLYGVLALAAGFLQTEYGLFISLSALTPREWGMLAMVLALGAGMGLIPGYRAYRFSLHDGLSVRL